MNKNIKHLLEYIVNEENIQLTNKLNNNGDFLNNIINYFKKNFNPKIIIDIKIENVNIQKNEFYEYLMINIAGQLIEQYVAAFMLTMFTSEFKFKGKLNFEVNKEDQNNKNTTKKGMTHDFIVQFKNDDNDEFYNQAFEIKSYNEKFGNITLTKKQRNMSNIGNPIYVLCNYKLSGNTVIVTEIDLVLGSELSKKSIFNNDMANSKHISKKVNRINIYSLKQ